MVVIRVGAVAAAVAVLGFLGAAPAAANNVSFSFHGASVTYTDSVDTVCVRAANDHKGLRDYAYAVIQRMDGTTVPGSYVSANEGQGWRCTGNLSIAEDRRFKLVLFDCTEVPGTDCGGTSREFYS